MEERTLLFEDFKGHLGDRFAVCDSDLPEADLTLDEASLLPERYVREGQRPPFSLVFVGTGPEVLPQRLYRLTHDGLGDVTMFLVPVGKDGRGVSYQAVFC